MKLFLVLFLLPISLHAASVESIICLTEKLKLSINILQDSDNSPKNTVWSIVLLEDESVRVDGAGPWQKEVDSDDAFSSFDKISAISYKNSRAVFVTDSGLGEVIYFPKCDKK